MLKKILLILISSTSFFVYTAWEQGSEWERQVEEATRKRRQEEARHTENVINGRIVAENNVSNETIETLALQEKQKFDAEWKAMCEEQGATLTKDYYCLRKRIS